MTTDNLEPEFVKKGPAGEGRERAVCVKCAFIDYQNPKIVAGTVVLHENKVLLCKRAIDPRKGYWTLPAGFMELGETVEEAAKREAFEEAGARLTIERMLAYYSIPHISQVQVMFVASLDNPESIKAGVESEEIGLFSWDEIPWTELAFPSVYWALRQYKMIEGQTDYPPFTNPIDGL